MRSGLVLASIFAVMLTLLAPLEAEAVECVGDRTYETAVADGCRSITGGLYVGDTELTNLDGLLGLTTVGGSLTIGLVGYLGGMALENIDGLSSLTTVGGNLMLFGNNLLNDINGLSALTSAGHVNIYGNSSLTDLDGLGALTFIESLNLNSTNLVNIDGLSGLAVTSLSSLYFYGNRSLENLDGLPSLNEIKGQLSVYGNPALTSIDGLAAVSSVGQLSILLNSELENLDGLSALTSVGGDLRISDNIKLCQASVDDLLRRITVGGTQNVIDNDGACLWTELVASILPDSRSVQIGGNGSAYATMINAGPDTGYDCTLTLGSDIPATLTSWATDPATNAISSDPNQAVDIPAGEFATWAFRIVPSATIPPTDVELLYECANSDPAAVLPGINTLLLSASEEPTPDIIAITLTATRDGILSVDGPQGSAAFATATINVGASGSITVEPRLSMNGLRLNLAICETDPAAGTCTSAIGPSVTTTIEADATPTFAVFATATGTIPLDPANYRIYIEFTDDQGDVRGSSSVAVTTE